MSNHRVFDVRTMRRLWPRFLLVVSGALLFVIGAAVLFSPRAFFAANGVTLGYDPSLLSEIRAPGGLLVGCAIVMLLGAFRSSITRQALFLAAMVYGSYGFSRLVGMAIDGMPSASLVGATAMELIVGGLCAASLTSYKAAASGSATLDATV